MRNHSLTGMFFTGMAVIMTGACSAIPEARVHSPGSETVPAIETARVRPVDPLLDHFIAWVPRDRARTATVAEALAQVEWGNAKEQVAAQLCNGAWLMNGAVAGRSGPEPATAPPELGGYPAWYYHISHQPGFRGCEGMTNDTLYRALRANLPRWIRIIRAQPETAGTSGTARAALRLQ